MNYLLDYLSDDYLKKIADYFASQRPRRRRPRFPRSAMRCSRAASRS